MANNQVGLYPPRFPAWDTDTDTRATDGSTGTPSTPKTPIQRPEPSKQPEQPLSSLDALNASGGGAHRFYMNGFVPWANYLYANQGQAGSRRSLGAKGGEYGLGQNAAPHLMYNSGQVGPHGNGVFLGGYLPQGNYTPGMANMDAWLSYGLGQTAPLGAILESPTPMPAQTPPPATGPAAPQSTTATPSPTPQQLQQDEWLKSLYGRR